MIAGVRIMSNKKDYITVMNVISCMAVVLIHTNGGFWTYSHSRNWVMSSVIECVMYFAVPIFFMISGTTLIDYNQRYSLKEYIIKRIEKVVIPFIFWSAAAFIYYGKYNEGGIRSIIEGFINCNFMGIYWFIPILIALYIAIPFISLIPIDKRERVFRYCIIVGFIFNCLIPQIADLAKLNIYMFPQFAITKDALIYVFIGYYISNYPIEKNKRYFIYALGVLGLALRYFGMVSLSLKQGYIEQMFNGYYKFTCVTYSTAVYLFLKNIRYNKKVIQLCEFIAKQTFGIYMVHYFIMDIIINKFSINVFSFKWKLGGAVLVFIISWGIVRILQKIPVLRKMVP